MNDAEYDVMYAQETDHWWYRGLREMIALALKRVPADGASRILDAGCGTGANASMLNAHGDVVCFDFAVPALAKCRERGHARVVRGSVDALPFADECFDFVVSMDVLDHRAVTDPLGALNEARRTLTPAGHLILNLPAYQWLYSAHDEAVHTRERYTRSAVKALLNSAGFKPVYLTYWNTILFPAIVVKRKFGHTAPSSDTNLRFPPLVESVFRAGLALERAFLRWTALPCGVSIFAVARKRD